MSGRGAALAVRMSVLDRLLYLRDVVRAMPWSRERPTGPDGRARKPSNGELRRWCDSGSVVVNGRPRRSDEPAPLVLWQLVFFPRGRGRTTFL